jgi:hypothetical protein
MAYTNQSNVEAEINRELTANEQHNLPLILAAVDAFINNKLGGSYNSNASSVRYYSGGYKIIDIDPVLKNDSNTVTVEHVNGDYESLKEYEDNEITFGPANSDIKTWILKRRGIFPCGDYNISVEGKFSLGSSVPDDIEYLATILASRYIRKASQDGQLKSESIEGYSRTFADISLNDATITNILDTYTVDNVLI